jgi:hypothetical protein
MRVKTEKGDVLNERVFAHIINSICRKPHGLSAAVEKRYPWANHYTQRKGPSANCAREEDRPELGSIDVKTSLVHIVIGLVAQKDWGGPNNGRRQKRDSDTYEERKEWFRAALENAMGEIKQRGHRVLALPHGIGCGLAYGRWEDYFGIIQAVHDQYDDVDIVLIKKEE